jgi:hypothetical protein
MKKIVLTMVALLSMTVAMAQENDKGERKAPKHITPEMVTDRMAKELSLTDAQKAKVLNLNKEYKDVIGKGPRMGGPRPPKPQVDGRQVPQNSRNVQSVHNLLMSRKPR